MTRPGWIALLSGLAAAPAAAQWTVVNLHPAGASESFAYGVRDGQQVGAARVNGQLHAGLWTGSAALWMDLHRGVAVTLLTQRVHPSREAPESLAAIKELRPAIHDAYWEDGR